MEATATAHADECPGEHAHGRTAEMPQPGKHQQSSHADCAVSRWEFNVPFSTNMAISETKSQGWRAIPTQ